MLTMTASAVAHETEEGALHALAVTDHGAWWRSDATRRRRDDGASAAHEVDLESQVARAGIPVIERLAEDLGDLAISIELTDASATVVGRVVGAHARSSALRRSGASVAAPITDPRRDVPVGAVGVTCAIPDGGALMLPYAQLAARTIAERIVDRAAVADRELFERFLRARRRARGPILAVNSNELLTNAAAARLVQSGDHARIWNWALNAIESKELTTRELRVGANIVAARCEPVRVGSDTVGALVHVEELTSAATTDDARRARCTGRPKLGWESLRSSEFGIADLVAEGLTNFQTIEQLWDVVAWVSLVREANQTR